ncbi:outer membrane beta-barrel protein [Prolixibacteraceae bacterium Z1-6]|uniref:Outer membrane beta-barrel protein n=1 Tax=Draconibacterium aestuarii TaxID=2998507 RepID=A0A9X3J698_9BACT|nr:outer membrane beta-barrel protein [Prolixibacteraceae bacterium Z1-6]
MKQKLVFILALTLIAKFSHCQIIDRYGINVGTSYSSQIWDYKLVPVDSDNKYKSGLQAFLQAEKDFGNIFSFRTEFGYIQKGFKNTLELISADGTSVETKNDNVILHDLALNLGLKIKPLKSAYSPYLLVGLRGDYLISYKDIEFEEPDSGLKFNMYESTIKDFNKSNLGGLLGLGIDMKSLIYLELEYNPNFTKNFDDTGLSIKDNCWGVKLGLNINKLTE